MPPLVKPPLVNVSAGQPITAQAWNGILGALDDLFDGINAFGSDVVQVTVTVGAGGPPVTTAVVVAVPASGPPVVAVPPHAANTVFTLSNLTPGAWTVHVAAVGFNPVSQAITVPRGPLTLPLASNTVIMPQLFGLNAVQAVSTLSALSLQIQLFLDVEGTTISHTSLPTDHTGSKVLAQFPDFNTRVVPASAGVRVLLAGPTTKASKETKESKDFEKKDIGEKINKEIDILNSLGVDRAVETGGTARVFIAPEDRPAVGESALAQPRME
jgi:hypothetical protein